MRVAAEETRKIKRQPNLSAGRPSLKLLGSHARALRAAVRIRARAGRGAAARKRDLGMRDGGSQSCSGQDSAAAIDGVGIRRRYLKGRMHAVQKWYENGSALRKLADLKWSNAAPAMLPQASHPHKWPLIICTHHRLLQRQLCIPEESTAQQRIGLERLTQGTGCSKMPLHDARRRS